MIRMHIVQRKNVHEVLGIPLSFGNYYNVGFKTDDRRGGSDKTNILCYSFHAALSRLHDTDTGNEDLEVTLKGNIPPECKPCIVSRIGHYANPEE